VFWSLSLAEWCALVGPHRRAGLDRTSLDRAGLDALMNAFPD
jgi:hypothetical protein